MYKSNVKSMFILFILLLVYGCPTSAERTMDDKLKNGYFAMCYTSQFADRFSLQTGNAMDLSKWLYAIALEVRPSGKSYHTYIHLYIDSSLDIYTPGTECNYYRKPKAEWFFPKQYNDKDSDWNADFVNKATMRALYRSQSRKGAGQSLHIDMFRKEFLPKLSLISMKINSSLLDTQYIPGEVLIQKNNVGDYLLEHENIDNPEHPENFYTFKIPEKLHKTIQPYLAHLDTKLKFIDESKDPLVDFP